MRYWYFWQIFLKFYPVFSEIFTFACANIVWPYNVQKIWPLVVNFEFESYEIKIKSRFLNILGDKSWAYGLRYSDRVIDIVRYFDLDMSGNFAGIFCICLFLVKANFWAIISVCHRILREYKVQPWGVFHKSDDTFPVNTECVHTIIVFKVIWQN